LSPVVLLKSASKPLAVLLPPVVLLKSACNSVGRVEGAGGVAKEPAEASGRLIFLNVELSYFYFHFFVDC
jgi:hypothetical protein